MYALLPSQSVGLYRPRSATVLPLVGQVSRLGGPERIEKSKDHQGCQAECLQGSISRSWKLEEANVYDIRQSFRHAVSATAALPLVVIDGNTNRQPRDESAILIRKENYIGADHADQVDVLPLSMYPGPIAPTCYNFAFKVFLNPFAMSRTTRLRSFPLVFRGMLSTISTPARCL